ncbi:hypothetical protein [Mycobacterium sp. IEC1808]|uniref:hypothetical protein n=1 Tax=Mycobacterium sp. IEC1808 TaxID=1743230 RepID=UPI00115473D1|nr:hypothetical protein [Mycobacterium sp. IEC1808]
MRGEEVPVPFRVIAERLGISVGSVQKALARHQRRQAEQERREAELEAMFAAGDEDGEEVESLWSGQCSSQEKQLAEMLEDLREDPNDELALWRLRHIPVTTPGHPGAS